MNEIEHYITDITTTLDNNRATITEVSQVSKWYIVKDLASRQYVFSDVMHVGAVALGFLSELKIKD